MWRIGQQAILESKDSIELSLAYILCQNPAVKPALVLSTQPVPEIKEIEGFYPLWIVLGLVAAIVVVTTVGLFSPCCCRQKQNPVPDKVAEAEENKVAKAEETT